MINIILILDNKEIKRVTPNRCDEEFFSNFDIAMANGEYLLNSQSN